MYIQAVLYIHCIYAYIQPLFSRYAYFGSHSAHVRRGVWRPQNTRHDTPRGPAARFETIAAYRIFVIYLILICLLFIQGSLIIFQQRSGPAVPRRPPRSRIAREKMCYCIFSETVCTCVNASPIRCPHSASGCSRAASWARTPPSLHLRHHSFATSFAFGVPRSEQLPGAHGCAWLPGH